MGTTILSFSDRIVIETLHNEKRSLQYIADYLGFSKTTIFNELHRLDVAYQIIVSVDIGLKKNVVPLVMDARLKSAQQTSRLARSLVILKLTQCFLVNAKDKPSLLLWNGRVA